MPATLDVRATSEMSAAKSDVDALGAAMRGLGDDVAAAGNDARGAALDFDTIGEGADNVSSKSSQAAGAMGDLAGGLELVGASGAADALGIVSTATMVAAGAGDVLNLVAETSVGKWAANTAAMIGHKAATVASTAATGVMTGATAALNAVLAVNPAVLVVVAIAALAAGLVLAYKHSETFRDIVDGAFTRARAVVEGAADKVEDFIGFTKDLPGEAREAWESVRSAIADKVDAAGEKFEDLIGDAKRLPREAASEVAGYFSDFFAPIATAVDWVEDLIAKLKSIASIDLPDFDIPFFGRTTGGGEGGPLVPGGKYGGGGGGGGTTLIEVTLPGLVLDPMEAGRQIKRILSDLSAAEGGVPA